MKVTWFVGLAFIIDAIVAWPVYSETSVTTYHYDNSRTGWNNQEKTLTATNFPSTFRILHSTVLDDLVDAQPLLVQGLTIAGGVHDVVYVATESNTVYAIDASTGAILLSRNLGSPVPTPSGCNITPRVGITSTPVIDLTSKTLYLIAYVNGAPPVYELHALNLASLADNHSSPVQITASHTLTNGSTFTFNASVQQQRPGLLELSGNIYAGFGSFCDYKSNLSRGWLLGWNASTFAPVASNRLNDTQATSPSSVFLSSIWMSGYGIAGGGIGAPAMMFATANSDCNFYVSPEKCPPASTYNGTTNIQESIVKTSSDPASLLEIFTPSNVFTLDERDSDLGAGGVLLLPPQLGRYPALAVGGGKDGRMFLLDRLSMKTPLDTHQLGACWCGPSYFVGSDGIGRIVTSQGTELIAWQLILTPVPHLVQEGSVTIDTGQDPGFFTVISSNGTESGTGIIWAVARPSTTAVITLYAFDAVPVAGTYKQLFSSPAGAWPYTNHDADVVPVVANGKVYVASDKALTIFGVPTTLAPMAEATTLTRAAPAVASPDSPHVVTGTLLEVTGSTLTLRTRDGKSVKIDHSQAGLNEQIMGPLAIGEPFVAVGSELTPAGALIATSIVRAKGASGELWPADH
jgi:hypothetical protein